MRFLSILLSTSLAAGPAFSLGEAAKPIPPDPLKKEKEIVNKLSIESSIEKAKHDATLRLVNQELEELHLRNRVEKAKEEAADRAKKRKLDLYKLDSAVERLSVDEDLQKLVLEKERISLEHLLALEKLKKELEAMELEQKRLEAKNLLETAKFTAALTTLRQERDKLALESQLNSERDKKALSELRRTKEKAQLELEVKLIALRTEKELTKAENDKNLEALRKAHLSHQSERDTIDLELKRMGLQGAKLKLESEEKQNAISLLRAELDLRTKKHEWKHEANKEPTVLESPYKDGRITISDRRIDLNGPIYGRIGDHVNERIHYFNNVSSDPIFLVIGSSPGGSVSTGMRILAAIRKSKAPVHVVLKSYAASMAAIIVSLAPRSYSYPDAVLLHHQMYRLIVANTRELREELEWRKKYELRVFAPLAKKFGYSMEGFRKKLYEENSAGDWKEFASDAQKLKWVGNIVTDIRETGIIKNPDSVPVSKTKSLFSLEEKTDSQGQRYVKLPRLDPTDFYFIYSPDSYYR